MHVSENIWFLTGGARYENIIPSNALQIEVGAVRKIGGVIDGRFSWAGEQSLREGWEIFDE